MTDIVQQSGNITPNHLASWTTDGVIQDAGLSITNMQAVLTSSILGVNFNAANSDNPIPIPIPAGFTRYRIHDILVSGASASLIAASAGVFTAAGGLGVTVVPNTSMTITTGVFDAVNSLQAMPISNQNTIAFVDVVLYFRVVSPQGSPATANVTINYEPLP